MRRVSPIAILTRSALLLAVILAAQAFHLPQMITGPLVNAVLIFAVLTTGLSSGLLLSILAVVGSFLLGFMKLPLPPLIILIMAANVVLVVVFYAFKGHGGHNSYGRFFAAMVTGAVAKYMLFYFGLNQLFVWMGMEVPAPILVTFGITQLFTALIGGTLAIFIDGIIGGERRRMHQSW